MKTDARRLNSKELSELRKRAVSSIQKGESPEVAARVLGVCRASVYNWLALYRGGGWDMLDARKRGGRPAKLEGKAIRWIYHTVTMKNPMQMKFKFALWTSSIIAELIYKRYGISLSRSSVSRLLNQMGLSVQRPLWRAYQQDPAAVRRWLDEEYPKIRMLARKRKACIYFADEAGVRSDHHSGTTWGKRGKTPIVTTTGARFGMNLISAVSNRGQLRFMVIQGRLNARVFIDFLKRLTTGSTCPVFLIVDGHPTHKARCVKQFVEDQKGGLELFFLPPYSPELNPDEYVWNDLKNNGIGRKLITGPDQMKKDVLAYLWFLQKSPSRVSSFFQAPETAYAA